MSARHAAPLPTVGTPLRVEYGAGNGKRRALSATLAGVPTLSSYTPIARNNGVHAPLSNPSNMKGRVR